MASQKNQQRQAKVGEAKTDKYPERPLDEALADPKDIAEVENRPEKDQIEDYHQKHPTLKTDKKVEEALQEQQEG